MKEINVLYVHGYGGSPYGKSYLTIDKLLPKNYHLYTIDYDPHDIDSTISNIRNFVENNDIKIVIGSSLGGFITLNIPYVIKIVFNPCYYPSQELPKLGMPDVSAYIKYETEMGNKDLEERILTGAIFTYEDELLGTKYIDNYKKDWNVNIMMVHGPHSMTEHGALCGVIPMVDKMTKTVIETKNPDNRPMFE